MRHLEARLVDPLVAVHEQVEVEGARAAGRPLAGAAERQLDLEQALQQGSRGERGLERDYPVQETRLVEDRPDGIGLVKRGDAHDLDSGARAQRLDRAT